MLDTGSSAVRSHRTTRPVAGERGANVPGLVAAGVWAVGLVTGLVLLATGHEVAAAVILVVAVMSPWFGLAVSRSRIPASGAGEPEAMPTGWLGMEISAR
ncbi:hypothetical protein LAUMK35_05443 [Mycobacterium pseudokansasii]|uniref:Uncharacterized protein n=1 Tax=Mycobacterium pseudokansasii TaxID=2341080 RepID=A0A498R2H2_9MYCO|nr:hypothetical protein LAUMK35_05443 [Mycobacterium pseudokansasii]VBA34936.1 hypothetical protein LAUMK21_05403 [Mycobacterium pseudokansasii]VBA56105.1 hypothetical protein LAUMK142_05399 [Mycobacterium pseudokansasii]